MSYRAQRSACSPQDYRPMSPTSQGLDRLRYYRECVGKQRLRQPMDLPRCTDNWTRYSGYLPPTRPPRNPPWILQPYADQFRGWNPRRPIYVVHPPGLPSLRQARAKQTAGHRSDVGRALSDNEADDNICSLATQLFAMDSADPSLYRKPIGEWKYVNR